ncbi:hypothetical protein IMZ08_02495 [Bacillus luteolus]|uniref:Uncharacterized protein n=2 Tax=Litchfieldia luteola TaxID=682179 RepID=A0ABR9QEK5_9BACI|nr:hypothetical protein [Cytobacillus luteolus]MBE4906927.1 hypothetical protein [Cytobacillus luteolus]MBP1943610.1 hypothetical protein [Cytobacillus luteolus]
MLETLAYIANSINEKNITWGVGGSLLLYFHQLVKDPNDIDLLVSENDALTLIKTLNELGSSREAYSTYPFCTKYFSTLIVNTTEIDVMGGFCIQHPVGKYKLEFDEKSVVDYITINKSKVPLTALEDWFVLYQLMPNKQEKVALLENYFSKNGIKHPYFFEKALQQPLPVGVREKIENLM